MDFQRFLSWFGRRSDASFLTSGGYRAPVGRVVYAVGDVHGEIRLLDRLLEAIRSDHAAVSAPPATLVFLGDYVDRGEDSRGVIARLLEPASAGMEHRYLLGNHEQAMLAFLADPVNGAAWLEFGGLATLHSYGVHASAGQTAPGRLRAVRDALADVMPPEHVTFLRNLEPMLVLGDYAFVHAGVRPGRSLDKQRTDDLLWIRQPFLDSAADWGKCIVHGHTIVERVDPRANRIAVDTGAYATGVLSAVALQGSDVRVITVSPGGR